MAVIENTWCDCDQMPGLHNPCDCDNEMPVTDAKHWLIENVKELFERIIPGTTNLEVNVTVTPYTMSVNIDVTEQMGLEAAICDCENWKEVHGHTVHVYDPLNGCQEDGPDTRAEDDLGVNWKVGFPHKCI